MTDSTHLGESLGEEGVTAPLLATIFYPKTGPIGKVWIGETDAINLSPEVLDSTSLSFTTFFSRYSLMVGRPDFLMSLKIESAMADETTLCLLCSAYREADRQIRG